MFVLESFIKQDEMLQYHSVNVTMIGLYQSLPHPAACCRPSVFKREKITIMVLDTLQYTYNTETVAHFTPHWSTWYLMQLVLGFLAERFKQS